MSQELLKKADMILADFASAGRLNPEQSDRFLRVLLESPTIVGAARTVPMNGPETKINKIGFGTRILRPAVENKRLEEADRSKPETSQITLVTKEVIAEVNIPYAALEDNIEKENLQNTLLQMIGQRAALDLEELVLNGDEASADAYLALFDGVVKRVTTNVFDASVGSPAPGNTSKTYNGALKLLAPKYRRVLPSLRHYVAPNTQLDYREVVAARQTSLGDATLTGTAPMYVGGIKLEDVSLMPADTGILTDPKNIVIGIQRDFQIESDKDIRARQILIVLTARVALALETEEAMVKTINFPVS